MLADKLPAVVVVVVAEELLVSLDTPQSERYSLDPSTEVASHDYWSDIHLVRMTVSQHWSITAAADVAD